MTYDEIKDSIVELSFRDKLRLAQLLIQLARKEEEEQYVEKVDEQVLVDINYVIDRLLKSKPGKVKSLENFIDAMFQFKGSISIDERNSIISKIKESKIIRIENNKIFYI